MLVTELRGWKENLAMSDDARRKCYLMRNAADEIERLRRCISMAMGCISPLSKNIDEVLAWQRLLDASEGREPRPRVTR